MFGPMLKWSLAGVVAVAIASLVGAQEPSAGVKPTEKAAPVKTPGQLIKSVFHKFDANQDGKLTVAEQQAGRMEWFKEMDANKDGKLSADEFIGQRFVSIDNNKDGSVTVEEYVAFFVGQDAAVDQTAACEKQDANGDGVVSGVEVIAYRKSIFQAMDVNKDGKISPDEMKSYAGTQFKKMDADNNGFVTVEEMIAVIPVPAAAPEFVEKKTEQPVK